MKWIIFSSLIFAGAVQAHLQIGVYQGRTSQGQPCQMHIKKVYFENKVQHPLNERAVIQVGARFTPMEFTVQHPPVVDIATTTAAFNHDLFTGVLPISVGAQALAIKMVHTNREGGPSEFHVIQHEYKSNKRALFSCLNLKK